MEHLPFPATKLATEPRSPIAVAGENARKVISDRDNKREKERERDFSFQDLT